jgi:hypothetical protein
MRNPEAIRLLLLPAPYFYPIDRSRLYCPALPLGDMSIYRVGAAILSGLGLAAVLGGCVRQKGLCWLGWATSTLFAPHQSACGPPKTCSYFCWKARK